MVKIKKKNKCCCGYSGDEWLGFDVNVWGGEYASGKLCAKSFKTNGEIDTIKSVEKFIVCPECGTIKADINSIKTVIQKNPENKLKNKFRDCFMEIFTEQIKRDWGV